MRPAIFQSRLVLMVIGLALLAQAFVSAAGAHAVIVRTSGAGTVVQYCGNAPGDVGSGGHIPVHRHDDGCASCPAMSGAPSIFYEYHLSSRLAIRAARRSGDAETVLLPPVLRKGAAPRAPPARV